MNIQLQFSIYKPMNTICTLLGYYEILQIFRDNRSFPSWKVNWTL